MKNAALWSMIEEASMQTEWNDGMMQRRRTSLLFIIIKKNNI